MVTPLLDIRDFSVTFPSLGGDIRAVRGINLQLGEGESVAVLGESGSGKSVTSRAILGLIDVPPARLEGSILFDGVEVLGRSDKELAAIRGRGVSMVFQDALDGLNPVYTVGDQISELLRVRAHMSRKTAKAEAISLMQQVGIPAAAQRAKDYPHQFSGGMRQRICIAMAVALKPKLLIADEPTTALDVTVQAEILQLIARLQREANMALIFVTHDLGVAHNIAENLMVMYAGVVMEFGPTNAVFGAPAHPYTQALMRSHPSEATHWSDLQPIAGSPPDKTERLAGCPFSPRCPHSTDRCTKEEPALRRGPAGHQVRCHFDLDAQI
ncbi:MAG: ABC transporter ATP-binding protein [Rhodobacteraceae bacterium]|nr:ABC transporter ATP-binding protein [Paracoccaceae bacterium]PHR54980.1 MAG: ABC transporter ATP-binding protein [Robiginitomaculum sp.]